MSVAPSPSSGRGEVVLQPAYFTSSAFVDLARGDVERLLEHYSRRYTRCRDRPFVLFKDVWHGHGWTWMQFKVFDARTRAAFLDVVTRLFSERIGGGDTPLNRATALFGLYAMLGTRPSDAAPSLYSAAQVRVTCDLYEEVVTLPDALDGEFLRPVRPHVVYVLSKLLETHAFQILPHSEMHPLSPRALPREVVVGDVRTGDKKRGRRSKRERAMQARETLAALDGVCGDVVGTGPSATRERYETAKRALAEAVSGDAAAGAALRAASAQVVGRVEALSRLD